ncbi:MAG: pentapeptide repeat-containing protein [Bryobacteraceae bacterium]|nr:pentapeptide repeat-containing protein [Bryobacteraceae bacterium]
MKAISRDVPDLAPRLTAGTDPSVFHSGAEPVEEMHLVDCEAPALALTEVRLRGCVLERVKLARGKINAASFRDVRLIECDLSNLVVHRLTMVRVEFVRCRLAGFRTPGLDCQDVLFDECDLRYAQMQGGKFRRCEFRECQAEDADFQDADLGAASFRGCRLRQADFQRAKLAGVDVRGSDVDGIVAGIDDLKGLIVDPAQALLLARLLGLEIR